MTTKTSILIGLVFLHAVVLKAEIPPERFLETIKMLDDTVKGIAAETIVSDVAQTLKCGESAVKEALVTRKWKLSSLAVAQFLADGKKGVLADYLKRDPEPNWVEELKSSGVSLDAAHEFLDSVQSEIALVTWDKKLKGRKRKPE
jgi:hypothetical protein